MSENERHEEMISKQVQSAIAPLITIIASLRKEVAELKAEVKSINDLVIGARFLGMTGKVILSVGAIIGMFWAAFLAINHKV